MNGASWTKDLVFRLLITFLFFAGLSTTAQAGVPSLILAPPADQSPYVRNGNILTVHGSLPPGSVLVSAALEDENGHALRDIVKSIQIDTATGVVSGKVFVGSFRDAALLFLHLAAINPKNDYPIDIASNTIFVDNTPPKIQITAPENNAVVNHFPIVVYGTAKDAESGVAAVEIRLDKGQSCIPVAYWNDGVWRHDIFPPDAKTVYAISVRARDRVGHLTETDVRTIQYTPPSPEPASPVPPADADTEPLSQNVDKSPDADGICTYRVTDLEKSRFQPTELFSLKEEMAIIVKGYGGKRVSVRIMTPEGIAVLSFEDFIPEAKHKLWRWKINTPGTFQAVLYVDGIPRDDIFFKVIP